MSFLKLPHECANHLLSILLKMPHEYAKLLDIGINILNGLEKIEETIPSPKDDTPT